jgi:hypothetical protein
MTWSLAADLEQELGLVLATQLYRLKQVADLIPTRLRCQPVDRAQILWGCLAVIRVIAVFSLAWLRLLTAFPRLERHTVTLLIFHKTTNMPEIPQGLASYLPAPEQAGWPDLPDQGIPLVNAIATAQGMAAKREEIQGKLAQMALHNQALEESQGIKEQYFHLAQERLGQQADRYKVLAEQGYERLGIEGARFNLAADRRSDQDAAVKDLTAQLADPNRPKEGSPEFTPWMATLRASHWKALEDPGGRSVFAASEHDHNTAVKYAREGVNQEEKHFSWEFQKDTGLKDFDALSHPEMWHPEYKKNAQGYEIDESGQPTTDPAKKIPTGKTFYQSYEIDRATGKNVPIYSNAVDTNVRDSYMKKYNDIRTRQRNIALPIIDQFVQPQATGTSIGTGLAIDQSNKYNNAMAILSGKPDVNGNPPSAEHIRNARAYIDSLTNAQ